MANEEFKLETRFSGSRGAFPYVVGGVAAAAILAIILIMTTGIAETWLPMDDKYLAVLIPKAPDGSEALSLQMLSQESDDKMLVVEGSVLNRTDSTITNLMAAIDVNDKFSFPIASLNVPVEPAELPAGEVGTFKAEVPLGENGLAGYVLQFRLGEDGPFIPHKDERDLEPLPQ